MVDINGDLQFAVRNILPASEEELKKRVESLNAVPQKASALCNNPSLLKDCLRRNPHFRDLEINWEIQSFAEVRKYSHILNQPLRSLSLAQCRVDPRDKAELREWRLFFVENQSLERLSLHNAFVSKKLLKLIAQCSHLKELELCNVEVGAPSKCGIRARHSRHLSSASISKLLKSHPNLAKLNLSGNKVDQIARELIYPQADYREGETKIRHLALSSRGGISSWASNFLLSESHLDSLVVDGRLIATQRNCDQFQLFLAELKGGATMEAPIRHISAELIPQSLRATLVKNRFPDHVVKDLTQASVHELVQATVAVEAEGKFVSGFELLGYQFKDVGRDGHRPDLIFTGCCLQVQDAQGCHYIPGRKSGHVRWLGQTFGEKAASVTISLSILEESFPELGPWEQAPQDEAALDLRMALLDSTINCWAHNTLNVPGWKIANHYKGPPIHSEFDERTRELTFHH